MARALDQIISELNNVYNPQRDIYNSQLQTLDPSMQAEEKGLQAAKQDAFGQITDQANRRGLFYSGIPIAEEQRYTGATYLPAVANLRSRYAQQRFNLQDALAKLTEKQYSQAYGIRDSEMAQEAAMAAARSGGGGSGVGGFAPSFGDWSEVLGAQTAAPADGSGVRALPGQDAYNDVRKRVQSMSDRELISDYNATYASAQRGNQYDKDKLTIYAQLKPALFATGIAPGPTLRAATAPRPNSNVQKITNVVQKPASSPASFIKYLNNRF